MLRPPPPPPSPLPPPAPRPAPPPPAAGAPPRAGAAGLAGAAAAGGGAVAAAAPAPAPEPPVVRAPLNTVPWKYFTSERPGGGGINPNVATDFDEATNTVCVSGSNEPPGQFDAAAWPPMESVAIGPSILLTDGGVNSGPIR